MQMSSFQYIYIFFFSTHTSIALLLSGLLMLRQIASILLDQRVSYACVTVY